MRRGTACNIVGTTGAEVKHIEKAPLALPLGELSPQVTERALRRFLNENVHLKSSTLTLSVSALPSQLSQRESQGHVSTDSPTVSRAFHAAPRPSSVRATPCQLPPREALVPCFWVPALPECVAQRGYVRPPKIVNCQLSIVNWNITPAQTPPYRAGNRCPSAQSGPRGCHAR